MLGNMNEPHSQTGGHRHHGADDHRAVLLGAGGVALGWDRADPQSHGTDPHRLLAGHRRPGAPSKSGLGRRNLRDEPSA